MRGAAGLVVGFVLAACGGNVAAPLDGGPRTDAGDSGATGSPDANSADGAAPDGSHCTTPATGHPCVLCDGQWWCEAKTYPPCAPGISFTTPCPGMTTFECFACPTSSQGQVFACIATGWIGMGYVSCSP